MDEWAPTLRDQKQYPHFDAPLRLRELARIANDSEAVATNAFLPFIKYEKRHQPFRTPKKSPSSKKKPPKVREIRYASHRDSAIYSRYRYGLAPLYEAELERLDISDCVLAYRHVPVRPGSSVGKCNIHHARDAFARIKSLGTCCAVVMDISKYFESLDHARLKSLWCRLLGVSRLPDDHYAVFEAITKYRIVELEAAYEALGFFGETPSGAPGYLLSRENMPKQLCTMADFRKKICGKGGEYPDLVSCHDETYGIPQGAPLSDLLANLYLIDFDVVVQAELAHLGGYYMRYSDDILLIIPGDPEGAKEIMDRVVTLIGSYGSNLKIKAEKCFIHEFRPSASRLAHKHIYPTDRSSNGLSYLGFRFDGRYVHLRDSTVAGLLRRVSSTINREVCQLVKRYPGKPYPFLESELNIESIIQKFGKVQDFEDKLASKRNWTFWTYAKRAERVFEGDSRVMERVSGLKKLIRQKSVDQLTKAYLKSL